MSIIESLNNLIKELKEHGLIRTKDISDTYHTIGDLYNHRCALFSVICNQNRNSAWKSWKHEDGSMISGMFIVGIETPMGQATYHYNADLWDMFNVKELSYAPKWDGHNADDVIERLLSLSNKPINYEIPNEGGYEKQLINRD